MRYYLPLSFVMEKKDFDAIVVGSGPNGLAAAITLQQQGLSVFVVEGKSTLGGGMRSSELTLPGFIHDVCSAIHPMAAASPFFNSLPLDKHGLEYIAAPFAAAHPFSDGTAAILETSIQKTAERLGEDKSRYVELFEPLVRDWPLVASELLGPLHLGSHPFAIGRFGLHALLPAQTLVRKHFHTQAGKGLFGGMAAHGMLPFSYISSSAIALALTIQGHRKGWPMIKGGTQQLANALSAYFLSIGGKLQTGFQVHSLKQLPSTRALLLDITPVQLLQMAGQPLSSLYRWQLRKYKYGMGVFKIDWALDSPVPFSSFESHQAGTVHLGGTYEEMAASEKITFEGWHPEKPFVLMAQQSVFDPTRAPAGKHTAWAYCHVPAGSTRDMRNAIESQVERFAPGFKERVLATHTMNTEQLEQYNPNYIGGDINGGRMNVEQLFTRPALRFSPYRTSAKGIYLCSSSTPPGGGVHGMCGYHAANRALKDIFNLKPLQLTRS
jgi:phytoene dehydrogenase-like protein